MRSGGENFFRIWGESWGNGEGGLDERHESSESRVDACCPLPSYRTRATSDVRRTDGRIQGMFLDKIDLRINLKEALPCDDAGMGKRKIRTAAAAVITAGGGGNL